jgi:hypothetical protein
LGIGNYFLGVGSYVKFFSDSDPETVSDSA